MIPMRYMLDDPSHALQLSLDAEDDDLRASIEDSKINDVVPY